MRAGFRGPLNQRFEFRTQARTALAPSAPGPQPMPEGNELVRATVLPPAGGRTVPSSQVITPRQGEREIQIQEGESFAVSRKFARLDLPDGCSQNESGAEATRSPDASHGRRLSETRASVWSAGVFSAAVFVVRGWICRMVIRKTGVARWLFLLPGGEGQDAGEPQH